MILRILSGSFLLLVGLGVAAWVHAEVKPVPDFDRQVRPILQTHCVSCHGGEKKIKGGLNLTTREGLLEGGNTGPAIDLANPAESLLLQAITHKHRKIKMPTKKLPAAQIEVLANWVKARVPWGKEGPLKVHGPPKVDAQARNFWSFRPVTRPPVPTVRNMAWVRNPIDAFVLAKLETAGLEPAPPANRVALLRRVCYDLIGLSPTPEEVEAVLADQSEQWFEKVVNRLLASPHYGERWARHWLDLVRYAETNSFERDDPKPNVWRYRDYVIDSLNRDKPFDQFLKEQLAGDELDQVTPETIIATGYYRLGTWDDEPADPLQARYDELDDIVATTGQVFLGLSVNCGRCHDHKIDPFPQKDYYRLLSFFQGMQRYGIRSPDTVARMSLRPIASAEEQARQKSLVAAWEKEMAAIQGEMKTIEDELRPHLGGGERDDFNHEGQRLNILRRHVPQHMSLEKLRAYESHLQKRRLHQKAKPASLAQALCVKEVGPKPLDTFVLIRGNPHVSGDKVEPGFPSVLTTMSAPPAKPQTDTSGRRRVLAEWLASPTNPLTARVMVNRIWQYHFGRGIVRSANDFGYQGTPPTHPELLDWLAGEFVAHSWRLKEMHRLLILSSAYRMSSRPAPAGLAKDPENNLFWRFSPRRLAAEEVRDSVLAVSGNLNLKRGGPSVYPTIPPDVLAGQSAPGYGWDLKCPPEERTRRSIYVHVKRSLAVPILSAFDAADPDTSCPVRFVTTQPTQALGMLNGQFINEQAGIFAQSVRKHTNCPGHQVRLVLRRVMQRQPTDKEVERGLKFIKRLHDERGANSEEALRSFCLLALNLNEFIYLD